MATAEHSRVRVASRLRGRPIIMGDIYGARHVPIDSASFIPDPVEWRAAIKRLATPRGTPLSWTRRFGAAVQRVYHWVAALAAGV